MGILSEFLTTFAYIDSGKINNVINQWLGILVRYLLRLSWHETLNIDDEKE